MKPTNQIVIYGGRFDPPGSHHLEILRNLLQIFPQVVIMPCGSYDYKPTPNSPTNFQRQKIVTLAFEGIGYVRFDFHDLETNTFSPTLDVQRRYEQLFPEHEIWHAIGADLVWGGATNQSLIQQKWKAGQAVWSSLNFAVVTHSECQAANTDLPPHACVVPIPKLYGRSTIIRRRLAAGLDVSSMLPTKAHTYICDNHLYEAKL
jgi:nicotinic acid mononucleotide adenylyltransferase